MEVRSNGTHIEANCISRALIKKYFRTDCSNVQQNNFEVGHTSYLAQALFGMYCINLFDILLICVLLRNYRFSNKILNFNSGLYIYCCHV